MPAQSVQPFPCVYIPDHNFRVRTARDEDTLSGEGGAEHAFHKIRVAAGIALAMAARGDVPAPDGFVPAAGEEAGGGQVEG